MTIHRQTQTIHRQYTDNSLQHTDNSPTTKTIRRQTLSTKLKINIVFSLFLDINWLKNSVPFIIKKEKSQKSQRPKNQNSVNHPFVNCPHF